jgi:hypothetical protein
MVAILPLSPCVDKDNERFHNLPVRAEVVEWQTRTFEGRVGKPMRVQVPPSAPIPYRLSIVSVISGALSGNVWHQSFLFLFSSSFENPQVTR